MLKLGTLLVLASIPALAPALARDAESDAWTAAMAIKNKGDMVAAAAAFESFMATFPQSAQMPLARVQAGIAYFGIGKDAQLLHRNTPKSTQNFDKALAYFEQVLTEQPTSPVASRASYMQGSTYLFSGDLELSEAAYSAVLDKYTGDKSYVGKALERRGFVRRHLLQPQLAIADMNRWLKEFGAPPETLTTVQNDLAYAATLDKPAPAFKAETWIQGPPSPLESLGGDIVALYFFATWCPHCREEQPFVLDFVKRFTPQGVRFVGSVDHSKGQTPDTVRKFLKDQNIPITVFQDSGAAGTAYGVTSLPHLVLIDREGKVRWRDNPSNLADWTIKALLEEGLAKDPPKKQ